MALIELRNVEKIYDLGEVKVPALRGTTLDIDEGEFVALIGPSHTLKSSSANLGAVKLSKIAMSIEKSARNGDLELPARETQALVDEYEKVKDALNLMIA